MATKQPLISSREAAERLGIKVETLYAYVSRGLIEAHQVPHLRGSRFHPGDVDALAQRGRGSGRRNPVTIESAVTRIDGTHYWYRGLDPMTLIGSNSFEQVCELLWGADDWQRPRSWRVDRIARDAARTAVAVLPAHAAPFDRLRVAASVISAHDELRSDLAPDSVRSTARSMIATLVAALERGGTGPHAEADSDSSVAATLLRFLGPPGVVSPAATSAIEAALILLADHELAASTMAARTAAAFKADPHAVTAAGLGALAGAWHGGASAAAEDLLRETLAARAVERPLARRIRDDRPVPGLGQPLYPDGDPRATALFTAARRAAPTSEVHARLDELLLICAERGYPQPNCDMGLATLAVGLDLEPGAGETLFAIARIGGWIAHALEEYESPSNLRPRAVYTGRR